MQSLKGIAALLVLSSAAHAQVPANPYHYSRSSSFTYYGAADGAKNGLLKSETIEPRNPQSCVTTSYTYDAKGNRTGATTSNCAGASGRAVFASRTSSSTYAAVPAQTIVVNGANRTVAIPAGVFANSSTNALGQTETRTHDPRFGAVLSITGPNALTTRWSVDAFGRKVREMRADNSGSVTYYCMLAGNQPDGTPRDTSANTPGCPTPASGEAPADAVMLVHSEPRSSADVKNGPFSRVYSDRLGREIRSVTESFDGASQPAGKRGALVARDTVYNKYGAKVIETQPYFLSSGSSTTGGSADVGVTKTEYDKLGRPVAIYVSDPNGSTSANFGAYGTRQAARQTIAYSGLKTTITNDKGQTRVEEKNVIGELVRVTDASGAQLAQQRDAFGNLIATKDALQNTTTASYDIRGRKVQMKDPDSGTWNYAHDALGQLVWQQSPNQLAAGTQTTFGLDLLGRVVSRAEPEYTTSWSYDKNIDGSACGKGIGKLCESNTSHGVNRKFVYDGFGRPINGRTSVSGGPSFASAVAYDANGRIAGRTYPSGFQVSQSHTALGYLDSLSLGTFAVVNPLPSSGGGAPGPSVVLPAGSVLWQAQAIDAWGRIEQQSHGNGVIARAVFEPATGRTTDLRAGTGSSNTVLDQHYVWDSLNNLTGRSDANGDGSTGAVTETFSYADRVNRLTSYAVAAPAIPNFNRTVNLQYNALGMLLHKSDVGNYSYNPQGGARPHALQRVSGSTSTSYAYDANGNLVSANAGKYRNIGYTSFNLPDSGGGIQGPGGSPKYTWQYDENHARIKETHADASGTRITWFLHPDNQGGLGFESETAANGAMSQRHYLSAAGQPIGVLVSTGALPTLASTQTAPPTSGGISLAKVEYWHRDHLGSLAATTDHTGSVTQRYAYDPFGKRRYTNGRYDASGNVVIDWSARFNNGTDRGYTGHEQLDDIGLVHMNGRVFDPTLGLFVQADPFIQDGSDLQNYNRYGYCLNNPLTCTDPSGYISFKNLAKIAAVVAVAYFAPQAVGSLFASAAAAGGSTAFATMSFSAAAGTTSATLTTLGSYTAAAVGGFSAGALSTGSLKGGLQGAFSAGLFHGAGDLIGGSGLFAGGSGITSPLAQVTIHGVAGCISSAASGGKCGPGALSAAFSTAATPLTGGLDPMAGTLASAVIGGTASELGGGKFANGAMTGSFSYVFNHLLHKGAVRDLFAMSRGHHPFAKQWAWEYRELISEDALAVLGGSTIGADIVWEGDHPNMWGGEHKAYNDVGGRKIVEGFFAEKGINATNQLDVKQSYELLERLDRHDLNVKMQKYADFQQSQGRINMNRVWRPRRGSGQPGD